MCGPIFVWPQEFFQFLVDSAHEELLKLRQQHFPSAKPPTMGAESTASAETTASSPPPAAALAEAEAEWSQVGPGRKNRAAVTRQVGGAVGLDSTSGSGAPGSGSGAGPATSLLHAIFCGSVRSVIKAPNCKPSATVQVSCCGGEAGRELPVKFCADLDLGLCCRSGSGVYVYLLTPLPLPSLCSLSR